MMVLLVASECEGSPGMRLLEINALAELMRIYLKAVEIALRRRFSFFTVVRGIAIVKPEKRC